jgi:hypothetical protein
VAAIGGSQGAVMTPGEGIGFTPEIMRHRISEIQWNWVEGCTNMKVVHPSAYGIKWADKESCSLKIIALKSFVLT